MVVIDFNFNKHSEHIEAWLIGHKMNPRLFLETPDSGSIVYDDEGFIAAGFLRHQEACHDLFLDGLIANPESSGKRRYRAIDAVVEHLIQKAKRAGARKILAYSKDAGTLKRSLRHGFQVLPHVMIALNLKGE